MLKIPKDPSPEERNRRTAELIAHYRGMLEKSNSNKEELQREIDRLLSRAPPFVE